MTLSHITHLWSPASAYWTAGGGGSSCGGGGRFSWSGAGGEVFAGEEFLELGILDIVAAVGILSGDRIARNFVAPLNLAHTTDSWRYRVGGEGNTWNLDVFD